MKVSSTRPAYRWHGQHASDSNDNVEGIRKAIEAAKAFIDKPSMIKLTTTIGWSSTNKANTAVVHGAALGSDETALTRKDPTGTTATLKCPPRHTTSGAWRLSAGCGASCPRAGMPSTPALALKIKALNIKAFNIQSYLIVARHPTYPLHDVTLVIPPRWPAATGGQG
jgi:hypothetical protein